MKLTLIGVACGLALGWMVYPHLAFEAVPQPIQFSHLTHTGESVGMDCMDCHASATSEFIAIPSVELCAGCHEDALTDDPEELRLVSDFITPGREIDWQVYSRQPAGTRFPHAQHVELAKIECPACHGEHGESDELEPFYRNRISTYGRGLWSRGSLGPASAMQAGLDMGDCDGCHRERGVVDSCLDCHR